MNSEPYNAYIGRHSALLSLVEIGLGSLLHGLRIPLSGQFLSCNQGFLLCRAVRNAPKDQSNRLLGASISNVAAVLKTLSPAGKRLTPMLAISAQGFLFSLGTLLFGANLVGCLVGISLLSLWAFAQPILLAYLLFGSYLLSGVQKLFLSIKQVFPWVNLDNFLGLVLTLIGIKILICWSLCFLVYFRQLKVEKYFNKMEEIGLKQKNLQNQKKKKGFLSFLLQPLFLMSFGITLFFFYFAERPYSELVWILIRPLAAAMILYFAALWLPLENWLQKNKAGSVSKFSHTLNEALMYLKKYK